MVPDGWELSGLGDVCQPKTGLQTGPFGSQLHASDYVEDGIPVVMPKDMINGTISTRSIARVSPEKVNEVSKHELKVGDIVFSRRGDLGRFAVVKPENVGWICGTGCMRARLKPTVVPDFVFCQLITHGSIRWLEDNAVGQTMPNLNTEILSQLPLRFPPLPEQQKIAAILSTWDRAIESTEKLIAAKQKRKQALMQQLLTGKVRFKEFKGKPWKWIELGELTKPIKRPVQWDDEQLYKLASIRRHSKGMFFREPTFGHQIKVKKLFTVEQDDFLISNIQAAYGAMGLVPQEFHGSFISDQYTILTPRKTEQFDIRFLGFMSESAWFRHQILLACNGFFAERLRLLFSASELLKRKLYVPPTIMEQRRIVEVLIAGDHELGTEKRRLDQLREQKKGLMQQLLTGKVRVNVDSKTVKG
ncbi:restriction endonuclease subunit S [Symmachiella dynata]|uniref:restriction endonuclease subunit S n=1 Tax=Symmachiella dynata TaxID=2527995 RepID=UPI0030EF007C|tara:strand:+ start:225 stop:1475 length:1251 start_codon:yes stop_codon:yes gene_type:complete